MSLKACLQLPEPPPLLKVEIPNFGLLEAARQSLYDLPDASTYLLSLQNSLATSLAPLRRMLETVQVLVSIKDCILAIPKAIGSLSPTPVTNCLKGLRKAFAIITSYVPPFPYLATIEGTADYLIATIDEVFNLFTLLDTKITEQLQVLTDAQALGDLELAAVANCITDEVTPLVLNVFDVLKFATPLLTAIAEPIALVTGSSSLTSAVKALANLPSTLEQVRTSIEQTAGVPVLDDLVSAMNDLRNLCVTIGNLAGGLHGGSTSRQPRAEPTYVNF